MRFEQKGPSSKELVQKMPSQIVLMYVIAGSIWILLSDWIVSSLILNPALLRDIQLIKGWLYVLITGAFLFTIIRRYASRLQQSEDARERSEFQFRLMAENTGDIIFHFALKPVTRFLYISPAVTRITGYATEEFYQNPDLFKTAILSEDRPRFEAAMSNFDTAPQQETFRFLSKDGNNNLWLEFNHRAIIDENGQTLAIEGIARDVTEQRKLERERLEAITKAIILEKAATLGTMAATVAHELNQPLNALKTTADSVLYWHNRGQTQENEKLLNVISKISSQAERIDKIIRHLRDFITQRSAAEKVPVNLNNAVKDAFELLGTQLENNQIKVLYEVCQPNVYVKGDYGRLEEVIINLANNSLQAMESERVTEKIIKVAICLADDKAMLDIFNSGTSIPDDSLEKVYKPFYSTKEKGMGLGLAIVKSIIEEHNGSISIINHHPGITFRILLPALLTK